MTQLTLSKISIADIKRAVQLKESGIRDYDWTQVEDIVLTPREQERLDELEATLDADPVHLLNESTIWSRAIYPLLQLSEQDDIRVLAGVPIQATYPKFSIEGIADGVIGRSVTGRIEYPTQSWSKRNAALKVAWKFNGQLPNFMVNFWLLLG
jgi:hypothetical protein